MNFRFDQFDLNEDCYAAYASDLGIPGPSNHVCVDGCWFEGTVIDYDASGEDIQGWNFAPTMEAVSKKPELYKKRLLIIND